MGSLQIIILKQLISLKFEMCRHLSGLMSLICDKIVTTQNLWFFRRNF